MLKPFGAALVAALTLAAGGVAAQQQDPQAQPLPQAGPPTTQTQPQPHGGPMMRQGQQAGQQLSQAQQQLQQVSQQMQQNPGQAQQLQPQARQALDQLQQAVQQLRQSPAGQQAQQQIQQLEQQIQQAQQQLQQDPQQAQQQIQQVAQSAQNLQQQIGQGAGGGPQAQIAASADNLIGKTLTNQQGEDVGEVSDVVVTPQGQVQAVVIDRGGALGLGGKQVALQWSDLSIRGDQLMVNMSDDQIAQLPEYQTEQ
ncbi:MAG: PRC-barrel domain-containing protein [Alphaproteobacteria bacterium]|nr:PRC-barrel domain-containing protein [Alphaproteobacteria bacterium]